MTIMLDFSLRTTFKKRYHSNSLPNCRIFLRGQNKTEKKAERSSERPTTKFKNPIRRIFNPLPLLGFGLFKSKMETEQKT